MTIVREGAFLLNRGTDPGPALGLESSHLTECVAEVNRRGYPAVFASSTFGFRESSLDCLQLLSPLRAIAIWDHELDSVAGLYAHPHVQSLRIPAKRPGVDFSRLPEIELLVLHFNAKDTRLSELVRARRFHLWHFNPRERSFVGWEAPPALTEFEINWANVPGLGGLRPMTSLRRLGIHRCRNLQSLAGLHELAPHLEHLVVTACGRLDVAEARELVAGMPTLKHAHVAGISLVQDGVAAT